MNDAARGAERASRKKSCEEPPKDFRKCVAFSRSILLLRHPLPLRAFLRSLGFRENDRESEKSEEDKKREVRPSVFNHGCVNKTHFVPFSTTVSGIQDPPYLSNTPEPPHRPQLQPAMLYSNSTAPQLLAAYVCVQNITLAAVRSSRCGSCRRSEPLTPLTPLLCIMTLCSSHCLPLNAQTLVTLSRYIEALVRENANSLSAWYQQRPDYSSPVDAAAVPHQRSSPASFPLSLSSVYISYVHTFNMLC